MREMKDSGISWVGEIPLKWNVYRNKEGFINTKTIVGENSKNTPLLSLTTKGIKLKDIDNPEGKQPESFDTYQCVEINDLVMCLFDLDISAVFSGLSSYDGMISPAYKVLKCNKRINAKYADYWFRYIFDGRKFNQYAKNIRYTLTYDVFSALPMLYPSVEEQKDIADYLDTKCAQIDTIIAKEQSVIEKLQEYKESIINEAVTKGIDIQVEFKPSGYDFIGDIPKSWKQLKVRYLGLLQNGISKSGNYFGHGMPFISYKDVYSSFVIPNQLDGLIESTKEEQEKYSVQSGDIFFTRTSETIDEIGISSVCKKTILYATFSGFLIRLRLINNIISPDWAKYYFRSNHLRAYFVKEMNLVTRASLSQELLKSLPVLIPSQEEQNKIIKYLDVKCNTIDSIILKKQALIDKLTEYKKSLIYEVVTGKKEVPHV
ncbi:restriction endonuclease subunit S [uncultured Veillonella sp.]|uniref:restriction endonuclease subunit S n=1 Tax=uncultured Veillonella sp. TaxID=159268 RepID=UPI0025F54FA8|nr:restriction endonuclease subunit S [uncultured Veillonella sp.]